MKSRKMKKERQYLLIDDDATSNLICKLNIKKADPDAAVISFNDPEDALLCIKEKCVSDDKRVCILFLDINMPTMTGWEFLDKFQEFDPKVRSKFAVYILTSSIEDFSEEKKEYPDVADVLSKPITAGKLKKIVEHIDELERKEAV